MVGGGFCGEICVKIRAMIRAKILANMARAVASAFGRSDGPRGRSGPPVLRSAKRGIPRLRERRGCGRESTKNEDAASTFGKSGVPRGGPDLRATAPGQANTV